MMVKRWTLAGTLLLASCTMIQATGNRGVLLIKPQITAGNYGTQAQVAPYTQASINHLILKLFTFDGSEHDQSIQKSIPNAQLGNAITFANLKANTTYRIKAYAYSSTDESALISTIASDSYTDVTLNNDDRPAIATLKVKLIDQPFNGQATASNIAVTPGGYATPGPEAMQFINQGIVSTLAGGAGGTTPGYSDGLGTAAKFNAPTGVAVDGSGNAYVADRSNHLIRKISSSGVVTTLAGGAGSNTSGYADGVGTAAKFYNPYDTAVDGAGNVYVADEWNHLIRKITSSGVVSTLAGQAGVAGYSNGTGTVARFNSPTGVAVDGGGNVYVADEGNNLIRKITSGGVVTTIAGGAGGITSGYADGTGTAAKFYIPLEVEIDDGGNLYVADYSNNLIRKITSSGVVTTLAGGAGGTIAGYADGVGTAAKFYKPGGVAVDGLGNVYVVDSVNYLIRKITSGGVVSTLAGGAGGTIAGYVNGTGTAAKFSNSWGGLAVDVLGNVYVSENDNNLIRIIK